MTITKKITCNLCDLEISQDAASIHTDTKPRGWRIKWLDKGFLLNPVTSSESSDTAICEHCLRSMVAAAEEVLQ